MRWGFVDTAIGSSRTASNHPASLQVSDYLFEDVLRACYMFSNNHLDADLSCQYLEVVLQLGKTKLLLPLLSLRLPTIIATWENCIRSAWQCQNGRVFDSLLEIGFSAENDHLIQSDHITYFAMAVDLGSNEAASSVLRLLRYGVSPDTVFPQSSLPASYKRNHKWCMFGLAQAAENRDAGMLRILIAAGARTSGMWIDVYAFRYANTIISEVAGFREASRRRAPCLRCVEVVIKAGMKADPVPSTWDQIRQSDIEMPPLGGPGSPRLLIDQLIISRQEADRKVYDIIAPNSQWAQTRVTVAGIYLAVEGGCTRLQSYLDVISVSNATKDRLLQASLSQAACSGANDVLETLLQFGVDPNAGMLGMTGPRCQWNPVILAAATWNATGLEKLLEYGASLEGLDIFQYVLGFRPTFDYGGKLENLEFIQRVGCQGFMPQLDLANCQKGRNSIIQLLLDNGIYVDVSQESLLVAALIPLRPPLRRLRRGIRDSDLDELQNTACFEPDYPLYIKLQHCGIALTRVFGINTLHMALRKGCNFATASYLIHEGVEVHSHLREKQRYKNPLGETTMLHDALLHVFVDRSKVVDLLIDKGADLHALSSNGISILEASLYGPCRRRLCSAGGIWAGREEYLQVFWKLFRLTGLHTPTSLAFKLRSLVSMLIELKESVSNIRIILGTGLDLRDNPNSRYGSSLLMEAIRAWRGPLVDELIRRGCDVNQRMGTIARSGSRIEYNTAIELACEYWPNVDFIRMLIENGAEVNPTPSQWSMTPLHRAAYQGSLALATFLLENGATVNPKPGINCGWQSVQNVSGGPTLQAVDMAAWTGHLDMVQLLVEAGGLSGYPGGTGLDGTFRIAKAYRYYGIVDYLQQHTQHIFSEETRLPAPELSEALSSMSEPKLSQSHWKLALTYHGVQVIIDRL